LKKPFNIRLSMRFSIGQNPHLNLEKLDIVVEVEFVGMRAQAQGVGLFALVTDPHLEEVGGEHVAFQQELVVFLQVT
jgi:hypothetical protein